ncbi:MAG TPA: hypothetical protein VFL99_14170 [Segeticoccus sp.]|uniref:hypothetical protein n=1 Tax=Segeticoccus sp. TaxID=2706531 RepID=UPI002D80F0CC|nr:hypothetical protein [Segeticoccus sp.]HET8601471.1 hypothetical protein [Segeticoccus sp.]
MSMTPPDQHPKAGRSADAGGAAHLAERSLFTDLVDDAAVFPPGLAPLPRAVTEHVARHQESYADLVGPLLIPASAAGDLRGQDRPGPFEVGVIGRPGTPVAEVTAAVDLLASAAGVTPVGLEVGWSPQWREALAAALPVSVEVPREAGPQDTALEELSAAQGDGRVQAKLRTGSTPQQPVPTASELSRFIRACIDRDLSFKLTGGLHHAVAHTSPEGEDQHGFLNVLCATRWALNGAEAAELAHLLLERDPQPLVEMLVRMSEADASVVRAFFTAYGCCGVLDPVHDLSSLGLIKESA